MFEFFFDVHLVIFCYKLFVLCQKNNAVQTCWNESSKCYFLHSLQIQRSMIRHLKELFIWPYIYQKGQKVKEIVIQRFLIMTSATIDSLISLLKSCESVLKIPPIYGYIYVALANITHIIKNTIIIVLYAKILNFSDAVTNLEMQILPT